MTVDSAFAGNGVAAPGAAYASISDMIDTVSKGISSGWRGGYVSEDTYNNKMTPAQQENYDNFDPSHTDTKNEDKADAGLTGPGRGEEDMSRSEIAAEQAAVESMAETGTVSADVQAEIDAALEAAGRSDLTSGNIGKQGTSFDDSAMGKGSGSGPDKGGNDSSGSGGGHGSMGGGAPGSTGGYGGSFR